LDSFSWNFSKEVEKYKKSVKNETEFSSIAYQAIPKKPLMYCPEEIRNGSPFKLTIGATIRQI
tara:strand:+ start:4258 stop:4446 length:189 start_codon:yes stop_codon:yes gene_type:complete